MDLFVQIVVDTVSILLLPFSSLRLVFRVPVGQLAPYLRRHIYLRIHKLRYYSEQIVIRWVDGKLSVDLLDYDQQLQETKNRLNSEPFYGLSKYFRHTLLSARRYMFVIYEIGGTPDRFIQVSLREGDYLIDFPLSPYTRNQDVSGELIEMLRGMGFTKNQGGYDPFRSGQYIIVELGHELSAIDIRCGSDLDMAVDVLIRVYSGLFSERKRPSLVLG